MVAMELRDAYEALVVLRDEHKILCTDLRGKRGNSVSGQRARLKGS